MAVVIAIRKRSTVPRQKDSQGSIAPTGVLATVVGSVLPPGVVTKSIGGTCTSIGELATATSGPSIVTVPTSRGGGISPSGSLASSNLGGSVDVSTVSVGGSIAPSGVATSVIDPATVVVLKSVVGSVAPTANVVMSITTPPSLQTKSIAGGIVPTGALATLAGGPSFVTVLKSIASSITPSGAPANVVVPPPVTFFAQAALGMITPTGSVGRVVSGPSLVTIPKLVAGGIAPTSVVFNVTSGPSFVTVPKAVSGGVVPHGNASHVKTGPSNVTITQTKGGSITPVGATTNLTIGGPSLVVPTMFVGMWNRVPAEFDLPPGFNSNFTAIFQSDTPATIKAGLDAMRARGMKGGYGCNSPADMGDRRPDGTFDFNFTKYKQLVDKVAAVTGIAGYISGGEQEFFEAGDEPQHAKWNGTWTPAIRKQCCQYIKLKLPGVKVWFRAPVEKLTGSGLPPGGWAGSLDYGVAQYTGPLHGDSGMQSGLTALQTFQYQRTQLVAAGLGLMCAGNWWNGGDGSSGVLGPQTSFGASTFWVMTPTEIKAVIDAAMQVAQLPGVAHHFYYWTDAHNPSTVGGWETMLPIQDSAPYVAAFTYAKQAGLNGSGQIDPPVYFTSTAQSAAPYPPPTIAVGGAVRDSMSDHKVFHLLDDAIAGSAEYPALNSDNSMIYFQRGGAGMLGNVTWNLAQSTVQVGTIRGAFGVGPFGVLDSVTWDRSDSRYMYFTGVNAPPVLYRRDAEISATVTMKAFDTDPLFSSFWSSPGQTPSALKLTGMHSSRFQERFVATVRNASAPIGVAAWSRLTGEVWNWQVISGKTIIRTTIDDVGQYIKVHFSDDTWVILTLGTQAAVTQSVVLANADAPSRDDSQANKMLQSSGIGVKSWTYSPADAVGSMVYSHPLRSSKTDLFAKGRVSLQAVDEVAYESLFYSGSLSAPWTLYNGEIYRISWSSELATQPNKGAPEIVRQGIIQLTRKPDVNGSTPGPTTGFFVSPGGSNSANGSITNPWPLSFALGGGAPIPAGSTVWVRGGVYGSGTEYVANLAGTVSARTVVRAYPGERPIINGNLAVFGADVTYWGLEVYQSAPTGHGELGVTSKGPRTKFVNMFIHDAGASGMGIWIEAVDAEVYGCLIYHNGTHTNLDHGIYTQNQTGRRVIRDCLIFDNLTYGLHGYSSTLGYLTNLTYDGNINFKNGVRSSSGRAPDYLLGGVPVSGAIVSNNGSYRTNDGGVTARFGYVGVNSTTLSWTDNYFVGPVEVLNFSAATQSGNTLISSASPPTTGIKVIVRPNQYEAGRANVGVWNWGNVATTSISVAGLGAYEVRDAENFFGPPVSTGVGPTVVLPLTGKFNAFVVAPAGTLPGSTGSGGGAVTLNRGEWAYDPTNQAIYVRCSDGLSPVTKRMVIFDWRFATEEIVMVRTTGILKGRLCHHHSFVSDPTIEVDAFRGGSVSYDGSRVVFTSNWGGGPTLGIYCALTDPRS